MRKGHTYQLGKVRLGRVKRAWREKRIHFASMATLLALTSLPLSMVNQAEAVSDLTPPTLTGGSVTTGYTMDTEITSLPGYNESRATLQVDDNLSGNTAPLLVYTSPSGKQTATGGSNATENNDIWESFTSFPQYSEAGLWKATLYLEDFSGNKFTYTNELLHTLGVNLDITLTGQGDTIDPVLSSFVRTNPGVLDVTDYSPSADYVIHLTENISGFGLPTLNYTSPSGNQVTTSSVCYFMEGFTATEADFDCKAYFNHYAESGTWVPDLLMTDGAGNTVHLTNENLLARGIDARVTVTGTSDTNPPTISDLNVTFANPPADNIPYGGAVVTVEGNVSDNLSGLNGSSYVAYTSPSGKIVVGSIGILEGTTFTANIPLPQYTEGGTWQPSVFVQDGVGNQQTYTSIDLATLGMDLDITVSKNITETADPGATITSDYEGDGATASSPIEASVTTPTGGPVSIVVVQSASINSPTNGYTFFDRQLSITAPTETVESPLTLSFMIDSSVIPVGETAGTLQITRNGTVVSECTDQTTATPNPCVFSRQTLASGDIEVKIHSTTASAWASGFPTHTNEYNFVGFTSGTKDYPKVNKAQAGQVVSVGMKIKGVPQGVADILAEGEPTSQQVNCTTMALIGSPVAALSAENEGLEREGKNKFEYEWRTTKSWKNTCRVFNVQLKDGSSQKALFKF